MTLQQSLLHKDNMTFTLAQRAHKMTPTVIREILKDPRSMRLSFVTPSVTEIVRGLAALARGIAWTLELKRTPANA
jgi:hypothetical protein